MSTRQYSFLDQFLIEFDQVLAGVFGSSVAAERPNPAAGMAEPGLTLQERRHVAGLMRVNHAGEVSAQALYRGQGLTARDSAVGRSMRRAALEEVDHLSWCSERIAELNNHVSYLNPVWYLGSFTIGILAGAAGDRWSLGFIAETERQVVRHLESHLNQLPRQDTKSRAILVQMQEDEGRHATVALEAGAAELPKPVQNLMQYCSRVMTSTAYWV